jgi:hypothetical protein
MDVLFWSKFEASTVSKHCSPSHPLLGHFTKVLTRAQRALPLFIMGDSCSP